MKKWKLLLIIWNDESNYKSSGDKNKVQNAFTVSQILTSVKEITPVTWMLSAITPLDHIHVNVSVDILEMDKTAQVNLIFSLQYLEYSCMTRLTTTPHHSAALQDNSIIYYS